MVEVYKFEPYESAEVVVACRSSGHDGYLALNIGDRVDVLHFEFESDGDAAWVFARDSQHHGRRGWLSAWALKQPTPHCKDWLRLNATLRIRRDAPMNLMPPEYGYLRAYAGDRVAILYIGSDASSDVGWLYGSSGPSVGWLGAGAVEPVEPETRDSSATVRARIQPTVAKAAIARPSQPTTPIRTRQPPARGKLRIIAFGLEKCDDQLFYYCKAHGGGNKVEVHEHVLREALTRRHEPRVDLVLDARCFKERADRITDHPGFHPETISGIVNDKNFPGFLKQVRRKCYRKAGSAQGVEFDFVFAVFSKRGKHRSVAIAHCLRYIGMSEGLNVHVNYLSEPDWGRMCRGCNKCLTDPDGLRQKSLAIALHHWQQR